MMTPVLSHYQIAPLLRARREHKTTAALSLDLNLSQVQVRLDAEGFTLPDGVRVTWRDAAKIARDENSCFAIDADGIRKIKTFSEFTNRAYSLYPTRAAPTMLVAGFPMHRIQDSDPYRDTLAKIKALAPVTGNVLDTATGLGYTAIELAKTATHVITIELDPAAQAIAKQNPWSRALFDNPKIEQRIGDSFEIVRTFEVNAFDAILHDPPTMALAGELYSHEFYRELFRVLKRGAKLFHYVGDPESKLGASMTRGVTERLKAIGFARVKPAPYAFGVVAWK
jgi:predicted methyltransferase